jgi:parallel beta-helix repeat protein
MGEKILRTKILAIGLLILFLVPICVPATKIPLRKAMNTGNTLYVGGIGEGNYSTIQAAVDNASSGDTVFVYAGMYPEHLVINTTLSLIGQDRNTTVINASQVDLIAVLITQNATGVTISHFTIINFFNNTNTSTVIFLSGNNTISDNILRSKLAINVHTNGNLISYNDINGFGIGIYNASNNLIYRNELYNSYAGIAFGTKNTIRENHLVNCVVALECYSTHDNLITGNIVDNSNLAGVMIEGSSAIEIASNIIHGQGDMCIAGVLTYKSEKLMFHDNLIDGFWFGFNCQITNKSWIYHNQISNNSMGFFMEYAMRNKIIANNIMDNVLNVFTFDIYSIFFLLKRNLWFHNFWNGFRLLPKPLIGVIAFINLKIPLPEIQLDILPAKRPFSITFPETIRDI